MEYGKNNLSKKRLIQLYEGMKRPRLIEEKMLSLLRQGKISKWFSGIGQEAISVGCTMALDEDEFVFPMHRNLGVFTSRNIPFDRLFAQWQGKAAGFTKGRDRSFHFGTLDYNVVGMISHLGPQLSLASGVALGHLLNKQKKVALAFTGEGGTSEGEFHEALNVAAVWNLPVIFAIENNGYGLSTPTSEQYKCEHLADRGIGYGIESKIIDGNNIVEVYESLTKIIKSIRKNPRPFLIEFKTFRRRGHEEASGTKYVPQELMDFWEKKDPIQNFENYLLEEGILSESKIEEIEKSIKAEIKAGLNIANSNEMVTSDIQAELNDVYASAPEISDIIPNNKSQVRYIDAITSGLDQAMQKYDDLVLMGQDIADYGGVFKITDGFTDKYGKGRVRNTPLCESAIIGISMGLSFLGIRSMVEMQFADFVTCGFNQIVNNLAKVNYRWGHSPNVVIRMPAGGGVAAGPFHSQCNEAWFTKVPGLKVVFPSTPEDAKGLLLASFEDPSPVLFFEHKALYRKLEGEMPEDYFTIPIGKAKVAKAGNSCSIITYGQAVHWATEYCEAENIDAEIIDLRSLQPLDYDAIAATVKKTNRVMLLHEDTMFGGIGAEIAAHITEHLFEHLDAPVIRIASLDTPIPFANTLEEIFLPIARMKEGIHKLLTY